MSRYQQSQPEGTFRVRRSFGLETRNMFVMSGDIVEGRVASGMQVVVPLNSAVSMAMVVTGVEYVDGPSLHEVGLTFECDDWSEVELLLALNIEDEILTVREATPS